MTEFWDSFLLKVLLLPLITMRGFL